MRCKTGIIVDGPGDFSSLRRRFNKGYKILKTDGPRGHDATPSQIAKQSKKQISILKSMRCSKVIVLLDFEQRAQDYDEFVRQIEEVHGCYEKNSIISVCVPNRMIENWYLADVEEISRKKAFMKDKLKQSSYEGSHGKREIKKLVKKGMSYSETQHGPELFEVIRFDVAKKNSRSFKKFLEKAT